MFVAGKVEFAGSIGKFAIWFSKAGDESIRKVIFLCLNIKVDLS
jgi:hypothetical protein